MPPVDPIARALQRERALALALLASLLVNLLACGCCWSVYRHTQGARYGAAGHGEALFPPSRRLLAAATATAASPPPPALRPVPESLAGLDPQGRIVFKAQILIQPDAAAVNSALGAAAFQPAQPSLSIVPAVDSSVAGGAGVPAGSEAAPAITTTSASQPLQFQGPLAAASVDAGSAGTVSAGTLSGATLSANTVRAGSVSASQLAVDTLQASGAVTATSFSTNDGSVSITADSAAVGALQAQSLTVQQTARVGGSLRVSGLCAAGGGFSGSSMALTGTFKAQTCSCMRYNPFNPLAAQHAAGTTAVTTASQAQPAA